MIDRQPASVESGRMTLLCRIPRFSEHPSMWIAILVAAVFITQIGTLHKEVINWDESTFILMAASVVDGNLPYVESFDNKPPLMFIMLAGVIAVFGKSLLAIRFFGDACILISSLTIFAIARRKVDTVSAGLGALLTVCFSAAKTGQFTSTELPATTMLMVALWLMVARGDRLWSAAMAGLLSSLATLTRSDLVVVAVVFGVYFLWVAIFDVKRPGARWSLFA
jgi:4-amino-4-deoxy-L-arabinose transferase-like glycosyltransferase